MAVQEYRQTTSWIETIKLGRSVTKVIEELPRNEEYGLATRLQHAIIDLPAAVGKDLQRGTTDRFDELIRLYAILGLIEVIYPVIDVAKATGDLDRLHDHLAGGDFEEPLPMPAAASPPADDAPAHDETPVPNHTPQSVSPDPNVTLEGPLLPDGSMMPTPVPVQPLTEEPPGSV